VTSFVSRAIRLYPAYWAGVLLTTAVATVLPTQYGRRPVAEVLVNLTMLEQGVHVEYVDPVYWTLWRELMFYLLFAIVVWRGVAYRRTVAFCVLWTVASVLAVWTAVPVLKNLVGSECSMYFIAGIAMYLMHRFRPTILLGGIVGVSWALATYNLTESTAGQSRIVLHHPISSHVAAGIVTLCFGMVLAVALGWLDRIQWRWLTVAGALTYPLYLIHQIIGYAIIRWLNPHVEKHC
jgi:peptidoglycan/LPS O-acetylase OafA/YrhL